MSIGTEAIQNFDTILTDKSHTTTKRNVLTKANPMYVVHIIWPYLSIDMN